MNVHTLANLYKKHLPARARKQVDQLCYAVMMGEDEAIAPRVEAILSLAWTAEDWAKVIRSPKLDDPGTDEEEARLWREMTGRG